MPIEVCKTNTTHYAMPGRPGMVLFDVDDDGAIQLRSNYMRIQDLHYLIAALESAAETFADSVHRKEAAAILDDALRERLTTE